MLVISGVVYAILSKSEVQPWNSHERERTGDEDSELENLKSKEKDVSDDETGRRVPEKEIC